MSQFVEALKTKRVSNQNLKGHVLFFIPEKLVVNTSTPLFGTAVHEYSPIETFLEKIFGCRDEFHCTGKLHFSDISGKLWRSIDTAYRRMIDITVDALRSKSQQVFPYSLNCKVAAIFYPKKADWNIYSGGSHKEQKLRHDETLLRILLKGAAHYLYDENNLIEVSKIITDGAPEHRPLDEDRIVWRINSDGIRGKVPLRDYVSFAPNASIEHLSSNHGQYHADTEEYKYSNMLQIADLLLGSIMRACYVGNKASKPIPHIGDACVKKDVIAQPIKEMIEKRKRGSGFKYSGHFKSFVITQTVFNKGGVSFSEVQSIDLQERNSRQISINFEAE